MTELRILTALFTAAALFSALPAGAQDKSASSTIQLPSAGGTVTQEEGTFGLNTNTGSANFNLPLPELPQRGRFGPNISLTYNQYSGDTGGGFGIGWGLTVPSIMINDDLGTAIGGTKGDGDFFSRLSMMGSRLIYLGNEGGVRRYRLEYSEQDIEITYHEGPFEVLALDRTGEQVIVTIPSGFEVLNPDGSRMIFTGDPAQAEGSFEVAQPYVTKWPLVMHLNANRDPVTYSYVKHGGRSYLSRITFAGGQSGYDFELLDTQASLVSNVTGARQVNAKLYSKITARFDGDVYNQWCFGYISRAKDDNTRFAVRAHSDCQEKAEADLVPLIDANSINVLDQLRTIYRFGDTDGAPLAEDTLRLPEIALDYSSWTTDDLAARDIVFEAPKMQWAGDIPPWTFELADLNMDALVDIVRTGDDATTVFAGEGALENAFETSATLELIRPGESGLLQQVVPRLADDRYHFADIFGDSYVDIIEIERDAMHIFAGDAAGRFPYFGRKIPLPGLSPEIFAGGKGRFQDLNMDGQSDIITTRLNADGRTEWQIFVNLTRRLPDGDHRVNFGVLPKAFPFESEDGAILSRRNTRLTDINGDRLPDFIVIRPADQGFCIYENRGNIFSPDPDALLFGDASLADSLCGAGRFTPISGMGPTDRLETMWYVDANGDGIMDFANMGTRTDALRVWLGFGDGTFLDQPLELDLNLRVQVGGSSRGFRSRVADLDADGQSEIIVFQKPSGEDVRAVVVIDFNRTQTMQLTKANLLTVVAFGSGRRHDIRYATSTDEMLRDRANGLPTRSLHFPIVLAKQMATSEGIPGQSRDLVQTDEYFYHQPFYDVINGRFLGFTKVEKASYGDEFAIGPNQRVTQLSSLTHEQYYTFSESAAGLHLAGKLKVRKVYEIPADPVLIASAEATAHLDPGALGLHSLSSAARTQELPRAGALLSCQDTVWRSIPRGDGAHFLRKTRESLTGAAGAGQQQPPADESCLNPTKTIEFADFDDFNLSHEETTRIRDLPGPLGLSVPGVTRTTQKEYEAARATLASLGIVNAISERRILSGTRLLSRERFTYLPESGGRLGFRALDVFSGLRDVPDTLEPFHSPTHSLTKRLAYDRFGNITQMSDDLGGIESVVFEETGTLPVEHRKHHGADPTLDQVTRMRYDGPRAGTVASQTTPLGMTIAYGYDALIRKTSELADDGAEKRFIYRIGEDGLPSFIMTSMRRYPSEAETPEGESEWIDLIAGYNARGNKIATVENVAEGGIRVYNFTAYNRNEQRIFRWTPYSLTSADGADVLSVESILALSDIPRPGREVGNAFTYDAVGRMVRQTHPSGKLSAISYNPWGTEMRTEYQDLFEGAVVQSVLNLRGEQGLAAHVVGDTQGTNHIARFVRDSSGYLTEILLPGETEPRRFIHNSVGDLEYQSVPGMGEYFYFYDSRGRQTVKARVAASGETEIIETRFDFLNRITAEIVDGQERVRYRYDKAVQIATAAAFTAPIELPLGKPTMILNTDPNGVFDAIQRFGYDRNGRMVLNEIEIGGEVYAESFHRTLDGRIDRSTGPRGLSSHFALGPDRNLRSATIEHPSFAGPETVIENIAYNPEGRIRRIDYRAGAFTELTYDPETLFLTRIVTEAGGAIPLQDLSMRFNLNGSINEIIDALTGSGFGHVNRSGRFEYDFKNQLTRIERYGEVARFDYAEAGTFERNDEFEPGTTLVPAPDAATTLLPTGSAAQPYSYDGFGQIATNPRLSGTVFDAYGRLIRAQTAEHDVLFGYDQTGRRLYKQVIPLDNPDAAELYLFPMKSFNTGPKGDESFVYIGENRLVRMEHETGRWFYYLKDHLESSDYVMTQDGLPVEQMLYRAYGTEHAPETLSAEWATHIEANADALPREKTHHRFTGQYLDDATGLYYYGARYYDPVLGRFVSPDPLYLISPERCEINPIACNLFAYANNNPMAFIDATGLDGTVAPDAAFRREAEENLQRFDPTARVDIGTGEISQSWVHGVLLDIVDFFVPGSGFDTGRELVSRIIESPQTVTIVEGSPAGNSWPRALGDPPPGPIDVTLRWEPSFTPLTPEFDPTTGTSDVAPDPAIVLGHELIHSTHLMSGTDTGMATVHYPGVDGTPRVSPDAEARTVGVGGTRSPDDITENDLRAMLGMNPRNHASPPRSP